MPPVSRGSALGAYVACFDLGFALAGLVTGLTAGAFGYPQAFAVGALYTILAVIPAVHAAREIQSRLTRQDNGLLNQ